MREREIGNMLWHLPESQLHSQLPAWREQGTLRERERERSDTCYGISLSPGGGMQKSSRKKRKWSAAITGKTWFRRATDLRLEIGLTSLLERLDHHVWLPTHMPALAQWLNDPTAYSIVYGFGYKNILNAERYWIIMPIDCEYPWNGREKYAETPVGKRTRSSASTSTGILFSGRMDRRTSDSKKCWRCPRTKRYIC